MDPELSGPGAKRDLLAQLDLDQWASQVQNVHTAYLIQSGACDSSRAPQYVVLEHSLPYLDDIVAHMYRPVWSFQAPVSEQ